MNRPPPLSLQQALQQAFQAQAQGHADQARQMAEMILKKAPREPHALYLLGILNHQQGDLPGAEKFFKKAHAADKRNPASLAGLGMVALDQGEFGKAALQFKKAIAAAPQKDAALLNNLGLALKGGDDLKQAARVFEQALAVNPNYAPAHLNLGQLHQIAGANDLALRHIRRASQLDPGSFEARLKLGDMALVEARPEEALTHFRAALEIRPDYVEAKLNIATVEMDLGHFDAAEAILRSALEDDPTVSAVWHDLGDLLHERGRREEAMDCFAKAVEVYGPREALDRRAHANPSDVHRLGRALERLKEYDDAFACHLAAQSAWKQRLVACDQGYHPKAMEDMLDRTMAAFDRISLPTPARGSDSRRPIFILGMPRSGTSLLEQILSSHPDVFGAGELPHVTDLAREIQAGERLWSEVAVELDSSRLQELAQSYLDRIAEAEQTQAHVVDKLPANFLYVGLIRLMFPDALIIHSRRNAMDTCLSVFTQKFAAPMAFDHDLLDLAHYYRCYHQLMEYWTAWDPSIVTIDYELMVADQEAQTRVLLERLDLPWDDACLRFHETDRAVRTASRLQVRQPIYKSSVEKWRRFETQLQPLVDALGPLAEPYV